MPECGNFLAEFFLYFSLCGQRKVPKETPPFDRGPSDLPSSEHLAARAKNSVCYKQTSDSLALFSQQNTHTRHAQNGINIKFAKFKC